MPRLIPQRAKQEEDLVVATETIYNSSSNSLRPVVSRGEVMPRTSSRFRNYPHAFQDAPRGVWRGGEPKAHEAAAGSIATFIAEDGHWVFSRSRLHPYDGVVRRHPQFFCIEVPRD
jgi:hypothetical protein